MGGYSYEKICDFGSFFEFGSAGGLRGEQSRRGWAGSLRDLGGHPESRAFGGGVALWGRLAGKGDPGGV